MGWWSSSASSDAKSESLPPTPSTPPMSQPQSQLQSQPPSKHQPPTDPNADFHAAFPHLAPQPSPNAPSHTSSSQPTATPQLSPEYPTTMSCRAAFDSAFYCTSLGGHFNDIYRYGELRSCSEHWADWRFCMGLKTRSKTDKELLIQERYKEKEERVRSKANSEDVWERREEGDRKLGAFRYIEEEVQRVEKA